MKTLVLFETPTGLLSCYLSDMPLPPVEGRKYVFGGKRYEVTEITECLGSKGEDGRTMSANEKLLDLLTAMSGDGESALALLARVTDIGTANTSGEHTTAGGIVTVGAMLPHDFDHVAFVRLRLISRKVPQRTQLKLAQFVNLMSVAETDGARTDAKKK